MQLLYFEVIMKKEFFVTTLEGKIYHIHTCMYLYDMRKALAPKWSEGFYYFR